eukprot:3474651-Lingulodinium_polyedra.AAC.1
MPAATLAISYLDLFERLVQASGFRGSQRVGSLRVVDLATPLPTSAKQRELLEAWSVWKEEPFAMPPWAAQ